MLRLNASQTHDLGKKKKEILSSITNTWPSKLLSNLYSQPWTVSAVDTGVVKAQHITYKKLFYLKGKLVLTGRSCEDFSQLLLSMGSTELHGAACGNRGAPPAGQRQHKPLPPTPLPAHRAQLPHMNSASTRLWHFTPSHLCSLFRWDFTRPFCSPHYLHMIISH